MDLTCLIDAKNLFKIMIGKKMNKSISIENASNEQLRDWLAIESGWKLERLEEIGKKRSLKTLWCRNNVVLDDDEHPIPNTIDAASRCLPGGWIECWEPKYIYAYLQISDNDEIEIKVKRTTEEATDRFRLAALAIKIMNECE